MIQATYGSTFTIVPHGDLPKIVPLYGKVSAYYIVSNTTNTDLKGNFIKTLPNNVTQVTCDAKYCGKTFNLGAIGSGTESCILKLTVKGPVDAGVSDLMACPADGLNLDGTFELLSVIEGPTVPSIGIAAGYYSDNLGGFFPLLVKTNDSGNTWSYPNQIFQNLKDTIDPAFYSGLLTSTACSGVQDKNVCIAPGKWCDSIFCENSLPLVAVGSHDTVTWAYPKSVFQDLKTSVDPEFTHGELRAGDCFGSGAKAVCVASGIYYTPTGNFPLLTLSSNGGKNWTYPPSIFQNLKTAIDSTFSTGYLTTASCTKSTCNSVCVAAGNFCTKDCASQLPLLAVSTDKGQTWSYPPSIFKNLNTIIDPGFQGGYFSSSSCTGEGNDALCIAVGSYTTNSIRPLLAKSKDGGKTWSYSADILSDLETKIGHGYLGGIFNAASCSGSGAKAICIASGSYFRKSRSIPLIAISKDAGDSWTFPDFIYTKLKSVVDADFVGGNFDGASCIGKGKKTICLASGQYCDKAKACFPLMALSTNGGKTWSYPPSVFSNLSAVIDPAFNSGLLSDVNCSGTDNNNFCIAAGQYSNNQSGAIPLIAMSTDSGNTWTYPPYVFKNLTSTIDPGFVIGSFYKTATSGSTSLTTIIKLLKGLSPQEES